MARYRDIAPGEMTAAQRRVHDLIVAGRRGRFGGPFQLLIRAPEICEHAAKLGEHLCGAPRCPTASRSSQSSPPHVSGVRNSSGLPTRRWPKRPVPLLRRSRPSAGARLRASRKRTRRSSSHLHRAVQHPAALGCELCRGGRQSGRDRSDRGDWDHWLLHLDRQHSQRVPARAP